VNSLYLLIPIALIFSAGAVWLLIWAVNAGQYDDLDNDAWRALHDDLDSPRSGQSPPEDAPDDDR
jgi:cbb3-type cytochrome oxidase maturation protein